MTSRTTGWGPIGAFARLVNPITMTRALFGAVHATVSRAGLAWQMARHDLHARHKGQFMGVVWTIAHPFLLMLIFLFVFGVVFKARIDTNYEMPRDYTTYILSGLVPWLAIVPALTTTCNSVLGSSGLVKQFHFDTLVLPIRDVMTTFYFWGVGIAFLTLYTLDQGNGLPWTYGLLPIVLLVTLALLIGLGWWFAAITVFFRDFKELMIVAVTMLVYILPIVYLPQWTPPIFQLAMKLNPLSYVIWVYQDVFYFGRIAHPTAWLVVPMFTLIVFASGYRVFRRLKPYFGNVL